MTPADHPEKLRTALDRGAGRDKVSGTDPAAAPLGTDEEAAGTPVPGEAVNIALENEVRGPARPPREGPEPNFPARTVFVAMLLAVAAAAIAAFLFRG